MINRRYRAGLYRHVSASNVKLFSSFSGSLKHFGITTFYLCCHPWFNCSVERCFGGCGLLLFISEEFLRLTQGENLAWSTAVVLVFCWTNWGFSKRKYYRTVQWYFSRVDVYLRLPRLLRSDIKQCCGGVNFIWTCQHIHKGTRLDSSHTDLCHRIKEIVTVF